MGRLAGSIVLLSGWRRALLAMLAGAFAVLGQAPYDFFAACFISFPILVWLLDGAAAASTPGLIARLKPAFATGWWFGFGYFLAGLWWIGSALLVEADSFAWALPFAVIGVPVMLALFYGLATAVARLLWSDGLGRIIALAFGFGLAEWLRGFVLTGFPWNSIGYAAMPTPLLMQAADLAGLTGMNALATFVFCVPALFAFRRGALAGTVVAVILVAAQLSFGLFRLGAAQEAQSSLAVRIVQPNVDLSEKWDGAVRDRIFKGLLDLSSQPPEAGKPQPRLIVWPETSVPYIFSENPAALTAIGEMLKPGQVLIAGAVREESESAGDGARYYNSVLQIDESGQIVDAVDKVHLVPFGEYVPFADLLGRIGLRQLVAGPMNFAPGAGRHAITVAEGVSLLPFICYEMIFPDLMPADSTPPAMLLNVTNDAWFGNTPGPYQHLRQAQIRSVETGSPLIRVANTGISAFVDEKGRILDALALSSRGVVDRVLTMSKQAPPTPWGDGRRNGLVIVLVSGFAALVWRISRRA